MNQSTLYGITGRTELGLNEYIETRPAYEDHGPAHTLHTWRTYTIQAQEDAHLFHLTEQFWNEATDRYYGDIPNDAPAEWLFPEHDDAPYVPCEQQAYVSEADGWTLVTTYDLSAQPTPFKYLELGTVFFDPFARDMVRKVSDLRGVVVASDEPITGTTYGYVDGLSPMNNNVYPALAQAFDGMTALTAALTQIKDGFAQHLAEGPSAQDLLVAQEWASGSPADDLLQREAADLGEAPDLGEWLPEPLATDPPQDHPEGWNAPASLPPSEDPPETQGIPVTCKVAMGNCYRLYHHSRQIAIVPNYAQGETIAQALAATFAGRLTDFSLTLDFIEGATP